MDVIMGDFFGVGFVYVDYFDFEVQVLVGQWMVVIDGYVVVVDVVDGDDLYVVVWS